MKTVLEYAGERYCLTYPCKCCGAEIEDGELCADCAKGNDPFFTCDNPGSDLKK